MMRCRECIFHVANLLLWTREQSSQLLRYGTHWGGLELHRIEAILLEPLMNLTIILVDEVVWFPCNNR